MAYLKFQWWNHVHVLFNGFSDNLCIILFLIISPLKGYDYKKLLIKNY